MFGMFEKTSFAGKASSGSTIFFVTYMSCFVLVLNKENELKRSKAKALVMPACNILRLFYCTLLC